MSIATELARCYWQMRTPERMPLLPVFQAITAEEAPPGSVLVFYGLPGAAVTERICVHRHGCYFHPPFHAALFRRDRMFHNVGEFRTEEPLEKEFKSTRRIDVIVDLDMTEAARCAIMRAAAKDETRPHTGLNWTSYGIRTFLHQGLSFVKCGKEPICSQDVVQIRYAGGLPSSDDLPKETAPFELVTYALRNPRTRQIRTLWVGEDYARKAVGMPIMRLVSPSPSTGSPAGRG